MTSHPPNFLLEELVPESRLEFARSRRSGGHAHRILSPTKNDLSRIRHKIELNAKPLTYGRKGAIQALFRGVSVTYTFISSSVSESNN